MIDAALERLIAAGKDMTFERLASETFQDVGHIHDWRSYVPDAVIEMWPALDGIARMSIYITTDRLATDEDWE